MSKARELSKLPNYVLSTIAELKLSVGKEQGDKAFVGGYYADGDGGGGDFYWDAVSVDTDNGGTIFQVAGTTTGRWKRIYSSAVNVKWFGAKGDGVADDTVAIQNAISTNNAIDISDDLECIIDSITILNDIAINLYGTIKHKDNSLLDMLISNTANSFKLLGDGVVDGNMNNQTVFTNSINALGVKNVTVDGIKFINTKRHSIYAGSEADLVSVKNCSFIDGELYGSVGNYCVFINAYTSKITDITNCVFKQTALPIAGKNNNPSAIEFSGATSLMYCSVNVSNCYFENLGFYVGSELLASVDCYGYRDSITYLNNVVKSPLLGALRITNFKTAKVTNNTIYQDVDCIIDGGTTYTSASSITVSLVQRGYINNKKINAVADISNNTIIRSGGGENLRYTILCASDSDAITYWFERASIENNYISGTIATYGNIGIVGVLNADISKNSIYNTQGIRIISTLQTSIADKSPFYSCRENAFIGSCDAIYLRETVGAPNVNCNLSITKNIFNNTGLSFSARYLGKVIVEDNIMPTNGNGDTITNKLFVFTKNIIRYASDTSGLTSNEVYSINNNYGRQSTINYLSAAPTTGTWKAGDIVYNTAPTAGGFTGWICTTAGTPGTWKTFGAISA